MKQRVMTNQSSPIGHVVDPYVVGGSVIGLKCREGVIMATDTLLSYGGLLKYTDVSRFEKISDTVLISATGQYADFQQITRKLKQLSKQTYLYDDNVEYSVKDYANYLAKLCYQKRNNMNPYFNNVVIGGYDSKTGSYLASIDMYGNFIVKDYVVTGFSKHFGFALIANQWNPDRTYQECKQLLKRCFSIIYMRDCHSIDQVQFAFIGSQGVKIEEEVTKIDSSWDFKQFRQRKNQKLWQ